LPWSSSFSATARRNRDAFGNQSQ